LRQRVQQPLRADIGLRLNHQLSTRSGLPQVITPPPPPPTPTPATAPTTGSPHALVLMFMTDGCGVALHAEALNGAQAVGLLSADRAAGHGGLRGCKFPAPPHQLSF
jgi:hypothetical protein